MMKKLLFYAACVLTFSFANAQTTTILNLSTGVNDDGSLLAIGATDPDWTSVTEANGNVNTATTMTKEAEWSNAFLTGVTNSHWIKAGPATAGYYNYKSKTVEIPEGSTDVLLNLKALSYIRNWVSIVKINADNTETATQIAATVWSDTTGSSGWLNSQNPTVTNYALTPGKYYILVRVNTTNSARQQSIDTKATITYTTPSLGVGENSKNKISIYPNPSSEKIFVSGDDLVSYKITSMSGSLIKSGVFIDRSVTISELKPGTYIITMITKTNETISQKIIKK